MYLTRRQISDSRTEYVDALLQNAQHGYGYNATINVLAEPKWYSSNVCMTQLHKYTSTSSFKSKYTGDFKGTKKTQTTLFYLESKPPDMNTHTNTHPSGFCIREAHHAHRTLTRRHTRLHKHPSNPDSGSLEAKAMWQSCRTNLHTHTNTHPIPVF